MVNVRREMLQGLVRLRILHAASCGPVSGVELSADLAGVGHRISPGTLYPLLHQMEKSGWVKSSGKTVKGKRRRYYRLTKKGRTRLEQALAEVEQFLTGILDLKHRVSSERSNGIDPSLTRSGAAPTIPVHAGSE